MDDWHREDLENENRSLKQENADQLRQIIAMKDAVGAIMVDLKRENVAIYYLFLESFCRHWPRD